MAKLEYSRPVDEASQELDDLILFSRNKHTEQVVDGLLAQALLHAERLEGSAAGGGGPDDEGWKKEVKAALQRAKDLVEKRLKNLKTKREEYLAAIQQIAEKAGVTLE